VYNINPKNHYEDIWTLLRAAKDKVKTSKKRIRIAVKEINGKTVYYQFNPNTLNFIESIMNDSLSPTTSEESVTEELFFADSVVIDFLEDDSYEGVGGTYFPLYNISTIDLSKFGIYTLEELTGNPKVNQSCFITAIENQIPHDKLQLLKDSFTSRRINLTDMNGVASLLDICIMITVRNYRENSGKFGFDTFYY
jgi:hypothetical protein